LPSLRGRNTRELESKEVEEEDAMDLIVGLDKKKDE